MGVFSTPNPSNCKRSELRDHWAIAGRPDLVPWDKLDAFIKSHAESLEKEVTRRTKELAESEQKYKTLVADSRVTVLIQGESGTGKELIAKAIHFQGAYRKQPFIVMDCSTLRPENGMNTC